MDVLGWIVAGVAVVLHWFTIRSNDRSRAELEQSIAREAESDATILELKADCIRSRKMRIERETVNGIEITRIQNIAELAQSDRDKWQVECAKLRATIERQAGDIVRLETSLKTAQRGNVMRASNR